MLSLKYCYIFDLLTQSGVVSWLQVPPPSQKTRRGPRSVKPLLQSDLKTEPRYFLTLTRRPWTIWPSLAGSH